MSSATRPGSFGYRLGAALIALGGVLAIALFVVLVVSVTGKAPSDAQSFGNNESKTVHVDAGNLKSVYYTTHHSKESVDSIHCTVWSDPHQPRTYLNRDDFTFVPSHWRARYAFKANYSGDYQIKCSGPPNVRYGVGEYLSNTKFFSVFLGIGAGAALAAVGFVALVVSTVRRI
jgi:hypothetical protein